MLVEGDANNADFMTILLQQDGHRIQIARTGPAAVHLAKFDPPDVVLVEIRLPGMDGWQVVKRLREQASEKKPFWIAVTSCSTMADRLRSEEAGFDLHLVKPVEFAYLRTLLKKFQAIIRSDEGGPERSTADRMRHRLCPALACK